jgi:hypothetical protein
MRPLPKRGENGRSGIANIASQMLLDQPFFANILPSPATFFLTGCIAICHDPAFWFPRYAERLTNGFFSERIYYDRSIGCLRISSML